MINWNEDKMAKFSELLKFDVILLTIVVFINNVCVVRAFNAREHKSWPKKYENMCGDNVSDRIIGGENATLGQFPWIARLHIRRMQQSLKNI